jgi:hypothetical protein
MADLFPQEGPACRTPVAVWICAQDGESDARTKIEETGISTGLADDTTSLASGVLAPKARPPECTGDAVMLARFHGSIPSLVEKGYTYLTDRPNGLRRFILSEGILA